MSLSFTDPLGQIRTLSQPPQRVVSLVPSQTQLLVDLGLGERLVGRTRFCTEPAEALANVPVVGGTKQFDLNQIVALQPDLILANKEENYLEGIEVLARVFPLWMSDIYTLPDALAMIRTVGQLVFLEQSAEALVQEIKHNFAHVPQNLAGKRVLYLIWRKPWMAAASQTLIDDILTRLGLVNAMAIQSRYPELSDEQLALLEPELIFLSDEPFPFHRDKYAEEVQALAPQAQVVFVSGMDFSWYGSHLRHSPAGFARLVAEIEASYRS